MTIWNEWIIKSVGTEAFEDNDQAETVFLFRKSVCN